MFSYLDNYSPKWSKDIEKRVKFGRDMVELRKQLCLSVEEMAKRLSVSTETLQRIESGQVCPRLEEYAPALYRRIQHVEQRQVMIIA